MKFTGFASGCLGKVLLVILCLVLGAVLALGGLAAGIYVTVTKDGGVGTISDYAQKAGIELNFEDDIKNMSVLNWAGEILASVQDLSKNDIGTLEKLIGTDIISQTIEDVLGVQASVVKTSTIDNLGKTVSDNLTIQATKDKFGIEFPDMPIFANDSFLNSPLSSAFGAFDEYKLNEIIKIDEESNSVLRELSSVAIKDIGASATDATIKSMLLCQLMDIDDESNMTLKALKYSCIESQYETDENGEIIEEDGKKVYKTKTITENGEEKTVELIGINDTIDTLCVKDVVDITDESAVVLRKMRKPTAEEIEAGKESMYGTEDLLVNDLAGGKVTDILNSTKIGELVDIHTEDAPDGSYAKSEPILIALKDVTVDGLNDRIKTLCLTDIFEEKELKDGALSLIAPDTTIDNIPSALTGVITTATTATLAGKNLIKSEDISSISNLQNEQQSFIYNSNIGGMLSDIIKFIDEPIITVDGHPAPNYGLIAPKQTTVSESNFISLTAFVNKYSQYDSVSFDSNVTVNIDENTDSAFFNEEKGCYLIPMFSVKTKTTITFVGGTVKTAAYEVDGEGNLNLSRNQYGYYYAAVDATLIDKGFDTIIAEFGKN